MENRKRIGIVGGVGPYAGIDLVKKIFDQTVAASDQEHLSVALLSYPEGIEDRTQFLQNKSGRNPAYAIARIIRELEHIGCEIIGIPCNTAHVPTIFDAILEEMGNWRMSAKLIHMIDEVVDYLHECHPDIRNVGLLSTQGTHWSGVYQNTLREAGVNVIIPDGKLRDQVHAAIYDSKYGIKAQSNPVTETARAGILEAIDSLAGKGAEAIVLGCSEIPLAVPEKAIGDTVLIDPTTVLARALVKAADPDKLKPLA